MEMRIYAYQHGMYAICKCVQLHGAYYNDSDKSKEEHNTSYQPKEVHGLLAKFV